MMRRLLIEFDDDLDLWLSKYVNQSDIVRKACRLYKGNIETGTVEGMRQAFLKLKANQEELTERSKELYEMVESLKGTIEELANR